MKHLIITYIYIYSTATLYGTLFIRLFSRVSISNNDVAATFDVKLYCAIFVCTAGVAKTISIYAALGACDVLPIVHLKTTITIVIR